ncbi:hypothetical protein MTBBW1_300076 [Desulfamplus magnetovallimortis]|uniref:Uncharacterized protein n=1 Tax=Desulfamplus magnetovallimortis TaxID=1246637 RepID=A0A1W1HG23_9BACT|nr:hypothetical protein [Desulfamplus magnetovallimortis]SLM31345.1 hypothetical protein MTBBW1_300076 [Desulfamplus magnetovallimortis]
MNVQLEKVREDGYGMRSSITFGAATIQKKAFSKRVLGSIYEQEWQGSGLTDCNFFCYNITFCPSSWQWRGARVLIGELNGNGRNVDL